MAWERLSVFVENSWSGNCVSTVLVLQSAGILKRGCPLNKRANYSEGIVGQ